MHNSVMHAYIHATCYWVSRACTCCLLVLPKPFPLVPVASGIVSLRLRFSIGATTSLPLLFAAGAKLGGAYAPTKFYKTSASDQIFTIYAPLPVITMHP
jgi:hypothetical protein